MRYTIKKIKIFPPCELHHNDKMYLGMSLNNTMFHQSDTVREMLQWIAKNRSQCGLLVGDYLHRYNEQIFGGMNEEKAIESCYQKGREMVALFREVADAMPISYTLLYTKHLVEHPSFEPKQRHYKDLYEKHKRFKELVDYTVSIFLRRQQEIKISLGEAERLCTSYLLEELVIFEILAEQGYRVNLYPGNQLPIMKELVCNRLVGVSDVLSSIQVLEIKFRPILQN